MKAKLHRWSVWVPKGEGQRLLGNVVAYSKRGATEKAREKWGSHANELWVRDLGSIWQTTQEISDEAGR